jgi:hypothetical protein
MENMNLPSSLILVWDLRRSIEMNQSLQIGIRNFFKRDLRCRFAIQFKNWWNNHRAGQKMPHEFVKWNMHQRLLIQLIQKGLAGAAIYENLIELDQQMINSCDEDIEKHISLLPLILQIPLLGMLFPAILMLLLIPALKLLQI